MRVGLALVGIGLGFVVILQARPSGDISERENQEKSYVKFFNLEELIKKISFKKFREFQRTGGNSNSIPSIDLTQEAIVNDSENPADMIDNEINASVVQAETDYNEQQEDTTEAFVVEEKNIKATSVLKYGYKILLKKISGKVVPVGKIKFEFPTSVEINTLEDAPEKVVTESISEKQVTTEVIENNLAVTEQSSPEDEESVTEIAATEDISIESKAEKQSIITPTIQTYGEHLVGPLAEYYLAPQEVENSVEVLSAYVPSIDEDSENPVIETVMKLVEDAETAVDIIKDLETAAEFSLPNCALPVREVEKMLLTFAKSVESVLPIIQEILDFGSSLASADTEGRARIGAELLTLFESVLDVIVPFHIAGCGADDSTSLLVSMSSIASQLDTLANSVPQQRQSKSLHDKATSLQLSSWVMVQLKHAVKLFYSQDGICSTDYSSTSAILDTLSKAIKGRVHHKMILSE